jgi:hypothetical protein
MILLAIVCLGDDVYVVQRIVDLCVVARFRLDASMLRWAGWS